MSKTNRQRLKDRTVEFAEAHFSVGLYTQHHQNIQFAERVSKSSTVAVETLTIPLERHYLELHGPLVILGQHGAGKTTALHELVCAAHHKDSSGLAPLPVVFDLCTWTTGRLSLTLWLAAELTRQYGVGSSLAHRWVEDGSVLPLLDGLDAVPLAYRPVCVKEINEYSRAHSANHVVVTCCEEEYKELTDSHTVAPTWGVDAASIVVILPMTPATVMEYLDRYPSQFAGLRGALRTEPALCQVMTTPLMLWTATVALEDTREDIIATLRSQNSEYLQADLFDRYLERMVQRVTDDLRPNRLRPSFMQATSWLLNTAAAMTRSGTLDFRLEDLSPTWLPGAQPRVARFIVHVALGLAAGAAVGCAAGIIVGRADARIYGASDGVAVGMMIGLIFALGAGLLAGLVMIDPIKPVDDASWSWSRAGQGWCYGAIAGLSLALPVAWTFGLSSGVATDLVFGSCFGLALGIVGQRVKSRFAINDGLKQSAISALKYFVLLTAAAAAVLVLADMRDEYDLSNPILVCAAGLSLLAPVLALIRGGAFCIKNLIIRAALAIGGHTPWRYGTFLNVAAGSALMIRQGGSFRFIHPLFQNHLASGNGWRDSRTPSKHPQLRPHESSWSAPDAVLTARQPTANLGRYDRARLLAVLKESSLEPPREKLARDARALPNESNWLEAIAWLFFWAVVFVARGMDLPVLIIGLSVALVFGAYAAVQGLELELRGLRSRARDAFDELERLPNRRPIVYLRSFAREKWEGIFGTIVRSGDRLEQVVVDEMYELGPLLAVGKPGEELPPIGAGRFYIKGQHWQPTILTLLMECQFVVIVCGATTNLLWEFARIVEHVHPSRLIVCIPKQRTVQMQRAAWQQFRESTVDIFPRPLPDDPGESALFLRFDPDWQPVPVTAPVARRYGRKAIRQALRTCIQAATS